jgi:hypothetical protein
MRDDQKKKRALIEKTFRASPGGIKASFGDLMGFLDNKTMKRTDPLILYTDEKKDYQRALWGRGNLKKRLFNGSWRHHMVNSKEVRNTHNPLFAVNYIDREFRKDMASHARETLQFARNVNEAMLRMSLCLFDHNYLKPFRVADRVKRHFRHAQVAGLERGLLEEGISSFFTKRKFWRMEIPLEGPGKRSIERGWITPPKKKKEVPRKHLAA